MRNTLPVVLPSSWRRIPERPCVAIVTISIPYALTKLLITSWGVPGCTWVVSGTSRSDACLATSSTASIALSRSGSPIGGSPCSPSITALSILDGADDVDGRPKRLCEHVSMASGSVRGSATIGRDEDPIVHGKLLVIIVLRSSVPRAANICPVQKRGTRCSYRDVRKQG